MNKSVLYPFRKLYLNFKIEKISEYIIVGGGIAGTTLAYRLMKARRSVILFNDPLLRPSTLVAAGMFNPLVFKRLTLSWDSDVFLPEMHRFYSEIENISGQRFLHKKLILKPLSEDELPLWKLKINDVILGKYIKEILSYSPVAGLQDYRSWAVIEGAGYIDTHKYIETIFSIMEKSITIVHENFDSYYLKDSGYFFKYKNFSASKIIFCEGAYSYKTIPKNAFRMVKGELLTVENLSLQDKYIINKRVFILPLGSGIFKIGSTYEWGNYSSSITREARDYLLAEAAKIVRSNFRIISQDWGIRPASVDRKPIIGYIDETKRIAVFNGLGTKGIMLAPKLSEMLCDVLTQSSLKLKSIIAFDRFLKD